MILAGRSTFLFFLFLTFSLTLTPGVFFFSASSGAFFLITLGAFSFPLTFSFFTPFAAFLGAGSSFFGSSTSISSSTLTAGFFASFLTLFFRRRMTVGFILSSSMTSYILPVAMSRALTTASSSRVLI